MTYPATEAARKEMWIEYSVSGGWIFYASLEGETGAEAYQRAREIAPQAQIFAVYACKKRNDSPHPDTQTARKALYAAAREFEVERRVSTKPRPSKGRGEPHREQGFDPTPATHLEFTPQASAWLDAFSQKHFPRKGV